MAFDKAKVIRAAEKSLSQGKISAAIKEYKIIVENEPEDFTALNMLGDLSARSGKKEDAIRCFLRIGNYYREQGFALKAIAMFKKIDRLNPNDPAVANTLGALYEMQGLVVDARAQYMTVAEAFQRAGNAPKALEVLKKIADLEPQNTTIRLKLAQGYLHENLKKEAADAFGEAGEQFLVKRQFDKALDCFSQVLKLVPKNRGALNGILSAHIALGTADEAAEIIERAIDESPNDSNLLSMLARAYVEADDPAKAESATSALVAVEDSNYPRFLEVAQLYLKEFNIEHTVRILGDIADHVLADGEIDRFMKILDEILARNPEHLEALRLLVRVHKWQCDDVKTRAALERLVDAAEALGNPEIERYALAQLVQLVPDARFLDRLESLGGAPSEMFGDAGGLRHSNATSVPSFESFALVDDAKPGATPAPAPSIPVETSTYGEFEFNDSATATADPGASFADLNEDVSFGEIVFETNSAESVAVPTASQSTNTAPSSQDALINQELESVDFYIAQGYLDIANDTLEMLERQFGSQAAIEERRRALANAGHVGVGTDEATPQFETPATNFDSPSVAEPTFGFQEFGSETFFVDAEPVAPVSVDAEFTQAFSIEPEIAAEVNSGGGGLDSGLAAIFDEFREAVEEEETVADDSDFETHYNMGLAYKEMDLFDMSVEEFQHAASLVPQQDGTGRYMQCCNMLGHCFIQKQMPRLAIMWFKKGLDIRGLNEDEYQAFRFELGVAYEQAGDIDKAIDVFTEVYGVDVSYRGVSEKLRELQSQRTVG